MGSTPITHPTTRYETTTLVIKSKLTRRYSSVAERCLVTALAGVQFPLSPHMYKNLKDPRLKEARLRHYKKNKIKYLEKNVERKHRNRKFIISFLQKNTCIDCPEKDIRCLHFDHRDRESKKFNIGKASSDGFSLKSLKEEISKCDVRCANCHFKRTSVQFNWYKNGSLV